MKHFATTYETTVYHKIRRCFTLYKNNVSANRERMFHFTATFDPYIVKHHKYTRWNILVKQEMKWIPLIAVDHRWNIKLYAMKRKKPAFETFNFFVKHSKNTRWSMSVSHMKQLVLMDWNIYFSFIKIKSCDSLL
jgi:hypothetical protein